MTSRARVGLGARAKAAYVVPMRLSRIALIVVVALGITQLVALAVMLPETVASHFGLGGKPDAFMPRGAFIVVMALFETLVLVTALVGPAILRHAPTELVNLPNKEYWLAPENKARAIERFTGHMEAFGAAFGALFLVVNTLVLRANLRQAPLEEAVFITALVAFFAFTAVWTVRLFRAFRIPPEAQRGR